MRAHAAVATSRPRAVRVNVDIAGTSLYHPHDMIIKGGARILSMKRFAPLLLFIVACRPADTRAPSDIADEDAPPPAASLSRFNVPIEYDFTPLLATVEHAVPQTFGSLQDVKQVKDDTH